MDNLFLGWIFLVISIAGVVLVGVLECIILPYWKKEKERKISVLLNDILRHLGIRSIYNTSIDLVVPVKSSRTVSTYDDIKLLKTDAITIEQALQTLSYKKAYVKKISNFLKQNEFQDRKYYKVVAKSLQNSLRIIKTHNYTVRVSYISPAGRSHKWTDIVMSEGRLTYLKENPQLYITQAQQNKLKREYDAQQLEQKHKVYYAKVNQIIDEANYCKGQLIIKDDAEQIDKLISDLFAKTINSIQRIKKIDSSEWNVIYSIITNTDAEIKKIEDKNKILSDYYASSDFTRIKDMCASLMNSQREFNEYIEEKVNALASLFGTRVVRNETINDDQYNYIHTYQKTLTPFTAEVTDKVFASAENKPIEYIVKCFYPDKAKYPKQIQQLHVLIEELETLKEAKQIIDDYKKEYQQYLGNVPYYVMEFDEDGFYSKLGFANISEKSLVIEYKFVYTSFSGRVQKYFTVPMTDETIIELIHRLEEKLTYTAFAKEQRALLTIKLRKSILERDNYTCQNCGNSTYQEPNLLLEVDHKVSIKHGGITEEKNLQTLCWRCNRHKGAKNLDSSKTTIG